MKFARREHSDATFGELGKLVGARWKAATPEERAVRSLGIWSLIVNTHQILFYV